MGHEFGVWPYFGGGTASLKFRQFESTVCDAFGVIFYLEVHGGGVVCFVGCWGVRVTCFSLLCC